MMDVVPTQGNSVEHLSSKALLTMLMTNIVIMCQDEKHAGYPLISTALARYGL
jgi:hypothetical protein